MPKTVEEVQKIVTLANAKKIPLVPAGASLTLSGLTIPHRGGIVLDMRRMDKIIELNRRGGMLCSKLELRRESFKRFSRRTVQSSATRYQKHRLLQQ